MKHIIALLEQGEQQQAQAALIQWMTTATADAQFEGANELHQLGFVEEAIAVAESLHEQFPDEAEVTILLAEAYIDADQEDDAIDVLQTIQEDDEFYVHALLTLADLYEMQGLFEVAERKLLQAKEQMPDEPIIDYGLGQYYFSQGRYSEALHFFRPIVNETLPQPIDEEMAECYAAQGLFEEALPFYEKAIEHETTVYNLFAYGVTAFQAEHYEKAISLLEDVKELDREFTSVYQPLARSYEMVEDIKAAYKTAKAGLLADSFQKELYVQAAKLALKLHNPEEAIGHLQQAIALDPSYIEAVSLIVRVYNEQEEYEAVEDVIEQVYEFGEEDGYLDWDLAMAKQQLEKYDEALNFYNRAYDSCKDDPNYLEKYGYFLYEEGIRDRAKNIFSELLKLVPDHEEAQRLVEQL